METQAAVMGRKLFSAVETQYGKVRGINHVGVKTFKGIHYGASTEGKNRFMPPQPLDPWTGVRDVFDCGPISPQTQANRRLDYTNLIMWDRQPGGVGEDCLVLNVWSRSVNDEARRAERLGPAPGRRNRGVSERDCPKNDRVITTETLPLQPEE